MGKSKRKTGWEAERTQISDIKQNIRLPETWGQAERNLNVSIC